MTPDNTSSPPGFRECAQMLRDGISSTAELTGIIAALERAAEMERERDVSAEVNAKMSQCIADLEAKLIAAQKRLQNESESRTTQRDVLCGDDGRLRQPDQTVQAPDGDICLGWWNPET